MQKENVKRAKRPSTLAITMTFIMIGTAWTFIISTITIRAVSMEEDKVSEITLNNARALFKMIVITRYWNAHHGGVYVPVTKDTKPNPYLNVQERDILAPDGTMLTLINPAFMTRQLSEIAAQRDDIRFRITSLNPVRPGNRPDAWEREALLKFKEGAQEYYAWTKFKGHGTYFRYMAPLWTEQPCLRCHAQQGYKLHQLRGGISVSIPANETLAQLHHAVQSTFNSLVLIWCLGLLGLCASYKRTLSSFEENVDLAMKLHRARDEIRTLKGLIPICAHCKRVKTDAGYWEQIEHYVSEHSEAEFSHGLCPDCARRLYEFRHAKTEHETE